MSTSAYYAFLTAVNSWKRHPIAAGRIYRGRDALGLRESISGWTYLLFDRAE